MASIKTFERLPKWFLAFLLALLFGMMSFIGDIAKDMVVGTKVDFETTHDKFDQEHKQFREAIESLSRIDAAQHATLENLVEHHKEITIDIKNFERDVNTNLRELEREVGILKGKMERVGEEPSELPPVGG